MALTKPISLEDSLLRNIQQDYVGQPMIRRTPPTAEHPFGQTEIIPPHEYIEPSRRQDPLGSTYVSQTAAGVSAIDHQQLERMRREIMQAATITTGVRGMDTHARRDNRITDYEFRNELFHRLEAAHPNLSGWVAEHADIEAVKAWDIIVACVMDQMLHGTSTEEPNSLTDINKELNKLEENKNGGTMAERGSDEGEYIPF